MIFITENNKQSFVNLSKKLIEKKYITGKTLLVISYIKINASYSGKLVFSIDFLAESLGYVPNRKQGKINMELVKSLEWLKQQNVISYDVDIHDTKNHAACFVCWMDQDAEMLNPPDRFVQLYESEFERIVTSAYKRKDWLLSVYLHMKKRICFNGVSREEAYCFASLDTIMQNAAANVNISRGSVDNVISELVRLGLLYEHITGLYVNHKGKIKAAVNFYTVAASNMNHTECDQIAKDYIEEQEGLKIEKFMKAYNEL